MRAFLQWSNNWKRHRMYQTSSSIKWTWHDLRCSVKTLKYCTKIFEFLPLSWRRKICLILVKVTMSLFSFCCFSISLKINDCALMIQNSVNHFIKLFQHVMQSLTGHQSFGLSSSASSTLGLQSWIILRWRFDSSSFALVLLLKRLLRMRTYFTRLRVCCRESFNWVSVWLFSKYEFSGDRNWEISVNRSVSLLPFLWRLSALWFIWRSISLR